MAFYTLNQILDIGTLHRLSYISIFIIQKDVEYTFSYKRMSIKGEQPILVKVSQEYVIKSVSLSTYYSCLHHDNMDRALMLTPLMQNCVFMHVAKCNEIQRLDSNRRKYTNV